VVGLEVRSNDASVLVCLICGLWWKASPLIEWCTGFFVGVVQEDITWSVTSGCGGFLVSNELLLDRVAAYEESIRRNHKRVAQVDWEVHYPLPYTTSGRSPGVSESVEYACTTRYFEQTHRDASFVKKKGLLLRCSVKKRWCLEEMMACICTQQHAAGFCFSENY
jgi:hypothetical protein